MDESPLKLFKHIHQAGLHQVCESSLQILRSSLWLLASWQLKSPRQSRIRWLASLDLLPLSQLCKINSACRNVIRDIMVLQLIYSFLKDLFSGNNQANRSA